jgi:purine nucleosidase
MCKTHLFRLEPQPLLEAYCKCAIWRLGFASPTRYYLLMPEKIIVDCDPGHDDAIALMLCYASPELEVLGVTTSFGNVGLYRTTQNALRILELLGANTSVYAGLERAFLRNPIDAALYHGESGLDGSGLPEATRACESLHAVQFMIQTILAHPNEVTVVATAPLTNLAMAIRLEPRIVTACKRIILMGGSTEQGNDSAAAEFNILADPHAARMVFDSGIPISMIGLNVTHQMIAESKHITRFKALGNKAGVVTANLLESFKAVYISRYGWAGPALHDPCTIAFLLEPSLFVTKPLYVHVETQDGMNFGRTTPDIWGLTGVAVNVEVAVSIDAEAVFEWMYERVGRL